MKIYFLKRTRSFAARLLFLLCGLCCCVSVAQVPKKKEGLTVKDREEWRKLLKWPDECERGFRQYQQYSRTGGLNFDRLAKDEYLVAVGCSGGTSVFMYYRENNNSPARLLKFKEYDRAEGVKASSYSTVNFLSTSFVTEGKVLRIFSKTSNAKMCQMHQYTFKRGRPVFVRSRKIVCSEVI